VVDPQLVPEMFAHVVSNKQMAAPTLSKNRGMQFVTVIVLELHYEPSCDSYKNYIYTALRKIA